MYHDSRARRLRGKGRINGDSCSSTRRNARRPGHRTIVEEKQLGTIGFSRSTRRSGNAGGRYGLVVASGVEAGIQARRDMQSSCVHSEPRSDGRFVENERPSHCHCDTTQ